MTGRLTLAHLSDIHLPPTWPALKQLHPKRMLGLVNWHQRRSRQHRPETLVRIVADIGAQHPDHIAVTGDLVNIGLEGEHQEAMRWLQRLGTPERVTAVPGNHDIYVRARRGEPGVRLWQAYMTASGAAPGEVSFPFVRRLGKVALIGLNSAIPTPLFHAFGRLGAEQLERLATVLEELGAEGLVRVVMIHHPPLPGQAPHRSGLQDAQAFADVLARHGAELVLHGHNHRAMAVLAKGPKRPVPVIGVPSASLALAHGRQVLARYNLYRIATDPDEPIEIVERGIAVVDGEVGELSRRRLDAAMASLT